MRNNLLLRIVDRFSLNVLKYYAQLKETQWFSYNDLRDLQWMKLKQLSEHFKIEITCWKDFYKLPLTLKEQLRNYHPVERKYGWSQTSGSTGEPFKFATPLERRSIDKATELRNWEWLGWNGQLAVRLVAGKPSLKMKAYNHLLHIACRNYRTVDESYVDLMLKHPYIIHGGTSAIRELTWLAQKRQPTFNKTRCVLIGEDPREHIPILLNYYRDVYQSYGLSECVNVAFECEYHNLHVNMEKCIVEEIDGELVITNLNNYVTPFIRYKTGDKGKVKRSNCKCGRKLDVITNLQGKGVDFYASEELKRPLGWWLVSPLGHNYHQFFNRYRVRFFPKSKTITVHLIPKVSKKEATRGLLPYLKWVQKETGLRATLNLVDEIPKGYKLFEVVD